MLRYRLCEGVDTQTLDDGLLLLDLSGNAYYALNASARWFFEQLRSGMSEAAILNAAGTRYQSISSEKLASDLRTLITDLESRHLIRAEEA
ncbi:MAG: PqqD family protein [Proteobacteria bacterium]|nr:PqqD family protein [Pseudomonadota bacterium]